LRFLLADYICDCLMRASGWASSAAGAGFQAPATARVSGRGKQADLVDIDQQLDDAPIPRPPHRQA
jgi:hypothetical protein